MKNQPIPNHLHIWAIEVEGAHALRLKIIIESIGYSVIVDACIHHGKSSLLYVTENVMLNSSFPKECFKYISRLFYLPFACSDPEWILEHGSVRAMFCDRNCSSVAVRLCCSPKELETNLGDLLQDNHINLSAQSFGHIVLNPTNFEFVVMCVFSAEEGIFRWGIVSKDFQEKQLMTTEALSQALSIYRVDYYSKLGYQPVCRAYYKLQEIFDFWLPQYGWSIPTSIVGVDVGASPGGWSQCLSTHCDAVLAIDPGLLADSVLVSPTITHLPHLVEHPIVCNSLLLHANGAQPPIGIVVCDMNCEANVTVGLLMEHVLPFVAGYGFCCEKNCRDNRTNIPDDSIPNNAVNTVCGDQQLQYSAPSSVLVVITLKLAKGPKLKHILRAAHKVASELNTMLPNCECCSSCSQSHRGQEQGQGQWEWDWSGIGDLIDHESRLSNSHLTIDNNDGVSEASLKLGKDMKMIHLCANSSNERTLLFFRHRNCL